MAQENIHRRENQAIRKVFDQAGNLEKVMIVGLDYAQKEHRVAFCNGQGDLLCKPVRARNDRGGWPLWRRGWRRCARSTRRLAVRFQVKLSRELTRIQSRLHSCADVCFPGLLDSDRSGIPAFSGGSFWLLQNHSPASVCSMRTERLSRHLQKRGVNNADKAAAKLRQLADQALPTCEEMQRVIRFRRGCLIAQHSLLKEQQRQAASEAARLLRQTPGALLTSIKGIGVTFAFQLTAELGDPANIESVDRKVNDFGLTENGHQTGGKNKPARKRGRQKRCNHFGKKAILGISDSVARWGPAEYRDFHTRLKLDRKNARYALGRKLMHFAISVLEQPHVYAPPERGEPCDSPFWRIHLGCLAEEMHMKWRAYSGCSDPQHDVLKQWEEMAKALYKVDIRI